MNDVERRGTCRRGQDRPGGDEEIIVGVRQARPVGQRGGEEQRVGAVRVGGQIERVQDEVGR